MNRQRGASLVETMVVLPLTLFMLLGVAQAALLYHAKGSVNLATLEAARAGSVAHADVASISAAFQRALLPYYGGGRNAVELAATAVLESADLGAGAVRVEILSPTRESFSDYASPALQAALHVDEPVIPNAGLEQLTCPRDTSGCAADPKRNASGQTLADANLLKLRITYGVPPAKQLPLVGRFITWALGVLGSGEDAFAQGLIQAHRVPMVAQAVVRMQSAAIRNPSMVSAPGPGNGGHPVDPGPPGGAGGAGGGGGSGSGGDGGTGGGTGTGSGSTTSDGALPPCGWWDPSCQSCPEGGCAPQACTAH